MIKRITSVILSSVLLITGCTNNTIETTKLTYSNLIDEKTQNDIKDILIENKIDKEQADYFIDVVQNYNDKSGINKLETSKEGFTSINTQQVKYDEAYLDSKWDFEKLNYIDFNCRLTSFLLFKNYIQSESKFTGDSINLMIDEDIISDNPMSKFSKEDIDKFINLYSSVKIENTQDVTEIAKYINKEWEKRKISFLDNPNVSMINVFLHSPEDSEVFVGHAGILLQSKDELLFIEKYAPSLPFQVSKFKNKLELKKYLMDRLDNDTSGNGSAKPIIMENNELIK